ncbi:hypothetical protein HHL17_17325 [Chitinophaga sp. G-6-1-13]|uniref:Uncharacterized protein n=1 Tax=Chitinophaga fulva TaxID=2728842 RepID=A0A848GMY6_9BACT|nr:hypothetical protein [Chitinophaga fulva]NML38971.1 hypothetical protein [Chitinophaga fulva]
MMTNSKKILLFVASATFLFASCKKDTQDQTGSEQYYKSQLEKLIHLKEIPSSSSTVKSTSSFKTYKEAYEAFAFVRTGEVFTDTVPAMKVAAPKGSRNDQARTDLVQHFSSSPSASTSWGLTSSLTSRANINFTCQWQPSSVEDEWIPSSAITQKSEPTYSYSGFGKMTSTSSYWTGNSFSGDIQGETVVAGTSFSWNLTAKGGVSINTPPKPWGDMPTVNMWLQVISH